MLVFVDYKKGGDGASSCGFYDWVVLMGFRWVVVLILDWVPLILGWVATILGVF